jgi:hypothetical protein
MASHRLEFGFLDYRSDREDMGSLYFLRNAQGKGKAVLRRGGSTKDVRVTAPTSFVRACDVIADCSRVFRVWGISNLNVRGSVEGTSWSVCVGTGDEVARGVLTLDFSTPHEIVHGLAVCMCYRWMQQEDGLDPLEGESRVEYKRETSREVPCPGFQTLWSFV